MKSSFLFKFSILFRVLVLLGLLLSRSNYAFGPFPVGFTSDQQQFVVFIFDLKDPAGHACCVSEPVDAVSISYAEGGLEIEAALKGVDPKWLKFSSITVDESLAFVGENSTTVAGFADVTTTITGVIEPGKISAKVTIGSKGKLPTGQPMVYDFTFKPTYGEKLYITEGNLPALDLKVAADTGVNILDRGIKEGSLLNLGLTIDTEGLAGPADWWILMADGSEISSFDLGTSAFKLGIEPTFQGELTDLAKAAHWLLDVPPPSKDVTIIFGVDRNQNGQLDVESLSTTGYRYHQY